MIDFPVTTGILFGRGSLMLSFMLTLKRMLKACLRAWKDKEFQVLFVLTFLTLTSGTIFYSTVEGVTSS